ncbi:MAG: aldo/keto reductase [Roseiarcus sp.]|jgi:D-threo-aldose 1-dehydrogenase
MSRDGALGELFRIKEEGLAKAVGLAAGKVDMMIPLLRDWDFDAVMTHNRFTLVNRNAEPLLDLAMAKGIAVMNAAPYASGVLAKGSVAYPHYAYQEADDAALAPIRRIEAIAARHHVPLGAAALQFSLRDKRITSTVCGVTKPERVKETLDWARLPIPEAFWQEVASLPFATDDPEATRTHQKA